MSKKRHLILIPFAHLDEFLLPMAIRRKVLQFAPLLTLLVLQVPLFRRVSRNFRRWEVKGVANYRKILRAFRRIALDRFCWFTPYKKIQ